LHSFESFCGSAILGMSVMAILLSPPFQSNLRKSTSTFLEVPFIKAVPMLFYLIYKIISITMTLVTPYNLVRFNVFSLQCFYSQNQIGSPSHLCEIVYIEHLP
jgi:hypothetical protein